MPGTTSSHLTGPSTATPAAVAPRRLPIGAEPLDASRTHFRVWAPLATRVDVVPVGAGDLDSRGEVSFALEPEANGYFSGSGTVGVGARYRFRLNGGADTYPDPASRFQPEGPHGPSMVVDPASYVWSDLAWPGVSLAGQVIYELHVGTFTREGTWTAAADALPELARAGITLIEMMPIADFNGRFGWGYDGVNPFAPTRLYGHPDDLRRFVDRAHALGVGVILDVVYNHLGPVGNYLRAFSTAYFTDRYENEWGDAINFDGPDAGPVREYFIANAGYWIDEFHFDGLRLDATQQIFDRSPQHILAALGVRARAAAGPRSILVIAENEPQDAQLIRPISDGGCGLDALWNDDFHHSAMVALTGHAEAYYSDTAGQPQEFVSAAKYGHLFQGQYYSWQQQPRGTPSWDIPPSRFVTFLQNHDQIANAARGIRGHLLSSPGRWRALTTLLLLMPGTPMLFQGQEFGASSPFLYFADFDPELAEAVRAGRGQFLTQFPSVADYETKATLDDPGDPATFERCKLDRRERATHAEAYALHCDLLNLRRSKVAFGQNGRLDGAVLSSHAFVLRFFTDLYEDDRLLVVNLGQDLRRASFAEPLLAPPARRDWDIEWSSEDPKYGGRGTPSAWPEWWLPGDSALVLHPVPPRLPTPGARVKRRSA